MKYQNILVLDTETTGDFGQPLIYDFGYRIIDREGTVLFERSSLVREIFNSKFLMDKAFYSDKVNTYKQMLENNEIDIMPYGTLIKEFIAMARKYKVGIISAYNVAFDFKALNGTMQVAYSQGQDNLILEKLFEQKNKKLLCIWNLACETILNTDEYRAYADTNNFKSEKGNYLSNAEVAFNYIKGLTDFKEKHMALADVEIEIEILLHILNHYTGNLTYGLHYGSWQKIQPRK
jgi:hypothetical protein